MDATTLPLDFYLGLVHNSLRDPTLYYFASTVFLIILSTQVVSWANQRRRLAIPIYGLDKNDKDAPKKRWMRDCINLIEEGYRKVIIPITAILHTPTRLQIYSVAIHHNKKPINITELAKF